MTSARSDRDQARALREFAASVARLIAELDKLARNAPRRRDPSAIEAAYLYAAAVANMRADVDHIGRALLGRLSDLDDVIDARDQLADQVDALMAAADKVITRVDRRAARRLWLRRSRHLGNVAVALFRAAIAAAGRYAEHSR